MLIIRRLAIYSASNFSKVKDSRKLNLNLHLKYWSSKRTAKSLVTKSFHKNQLDEQQFKVDSSEENACDELKELKKYFKDCENEDSSILDLENDEFLGEENSLTQFDLNEGGESDFSEDFEKSLENQLTTKEESKEDQEKQPYEKNDSFAQKKGMMFLRKNKINQPTFLERKFGLNISSDPKERQTDLQRFVLKSLQLLSIKEIQHFIQIIEYFKSKLTSHSFKNSQNVHEDFFMKQIYKLFEKSNNNKILQMREVIIFFLFQDKSEELMELFLKCDLIDLNMHLFVNNVSDYEKNYEIRNKFKQFDAFSKHCQPNGNYFLLSELAEKYNNIDYQKYSTLQLDSINHNRNQLEDQLDETDKDKQFQTPQKSKDLLSNLKNKKNSSIKGEEEDELLIDLPAQSQFQQEDKVQKMFSKVSQYEKQKNSNNNLDAQVFDQLYNNKSEKKKQDLINLKDEATQSISGKKNTNSKSFQDTWSSSLLEDDFFGGQLSEFNSQFTKNKETNIDDSNQSMEQNTINNFILEPSLKSQMKIQQIEKEFQDSFDHNLIDDITAQSLSLPQTLSKSINSDNMSSSIKLQEKEVANLLDLEKERTELSTKRINKIHNNKMVLQSNFERDIQQYDEIIILNQEEGLFSKKFEATNWVYMFHLPYDLHEVPNYTQYVKGLVESCIGEVEEVHFFNYKDFFEIELSKAKELTEEQKKLNAQLQEEFIQMNTTKKKSTKTSKKSSTSVTDNKEKENNKPLAKKTVSQLSDEELLEHLYINQKINPEYCTKTISRTEKILQRIQTKKEEKFNRSYAMIKFKSKESKDKCISQDIRLFGIQSFNQVFHFDDADYKKSVLITKIPWGINLQLFIFKINQQLKQCGLKHIKISLENVNLKKVITKYFLLIKFKSFQDSFDVVRAFQKNNFIIETQRLSCHHIYGSLKQDKRGFHEITDHQFDQDLKLLEKVNEIKVFEIWNIYKDNTNTFIKDNKIEDVSANIELKEEELENYNDIDHDIIMQKSNASAFNTSSGFQKSSVFSQMKLINQYGSHQSEHALSTNGIQEEFLDFEEEKKKK